MWIMSSAVRQQHVQLHSQFHTLIWSTQTDAGSVHSPPVTGRHHCCWDTQEAGCDITVMSENVCVCVCVAWTHWHDFLIIIIIIIFIDVSKDSELLASLTVDLNADRWGAGGPAGCWLRPSDMSTWTDASEHRFQVFPSVFTHSLTLSHNPDDLLTSFNSHCQSTLDHPPLA